MLRRIEGIVESITSEREGAQELLVRVAASIGLPDEADAETYLRPTLNLTDLTGHAEVGDRVLLNTIAVEMGLGTGGLDFVICILQKLPPDGPPPGHILKLRYTPLQTPVLAVEAPESPHHEVIKRFETLEEYPVVCAELHSQLPAICSAARWAIQEGGSPRPPRIVYIMTDGAALPIGLSRLASQMRELDLIQATITAGQAFGGDYEAINLYSALAAAKTVANADIIVVAQGPGNVGSETPLGFSGVEQGLAINAAASLGGTPIMVPRISFADPRPRHRGLSHHSITVLRRVARAHTLLPLPRLPKAQMQALRASLESNNIEKYHQPIVVPSDRAYEAFRALPFKVTTMGRNPDQERPFFLAAVAAGLLAAQCIEANIV